MTTRSISLRCGALDANYGVKGAGSAFVYDDLDMEQAGSALVRGCNDTPATSNK